MMARTLAVRKPQSFSFMLIGVLAAVLLLGSVAWDLAMLPHDAALGLDFGAFYAASVTLQHGHDPFSWAQIGATEAHLRAVGDPRQFMAFNSYVNPPLFAWVMGALTRLPARPAYAIWLVMTMAALIVAAVLAGRLYGVRGRGWAFLLFVATPIPAICLFLGQQTPFLLAGLAAALLAIRQGRCGLAGVALTVGWIKPHLLFPLMVVIVATLGWREARRLLLAFCGASVVLGALSWLVAGGSLFAAWGRDLVLYGHTMDTRQPDLSCLAGLYLSVVGRPWSSLLAAGCVGLWLLFAGFLVWSARRRRVTARDSAWLRIVALALTGWLLCTPYVHPADLILLLVALPAVLGCCLEGLQHAPVRLAVGLLLTAPEADLLGFRPNYVLSYSVLVPIAILVALRPWQTLRPTVPPAAPGADSA